MSKILSLLLLALTITARAQTTDFTVQQLSLPSEIAFFDNQFSGLYIHKGQLFLLSESRLQDRAEAKLYAIRLADLDRKMADTSYVLPFRKYPLQNLEAARSQMQAAGQSYEGLEALVIDGNDVYLSVETETRSSLSYLLKGKLEAGSVVLDQSFLLPITKPTGANGLPVYNAAFEAVAKHRKSLFAFNEYNYFPGNNLVARIPLRRLSGRTPVSTSTISRLPFRITDVTATGRNRFTAINYFFSGSGADTVYRVPPQDREADELVRTGTSYRSYTRLIELELKDNRFTWKPLWPFPTEYWGYNWEGIAAYRGGYFVLNDKYTPRKPYQSTLVYLRRK